MTITREQVADLRGGDVVELHRQGWADDVVVRGTLRGDSCAGELYIGDYSIFSENGNEPDWLTFPGTTLTVVSRAPRPLYVNHPRTEPTWGDVVRSAEPGDADDPSTWVHLPSDGYNVGLWASVTSSEDLIRCRQRHLPPRLRLLVDGETGQVVQ